MIKKKRERREKIISITVHVTFIHYADFLNINKAARAYSTSQMTCQNSLGTKI